MNKLKIKKLKKNGWNVGFVEGFLGLTKKELRILNKLMAEGYRENAKENTQLMEDFKYVDEEVW